MESRFATLTFQASDRSDVFAVVDVHEFAFEDSEEPFEGIEDPHIENSNVWMSGKIPKMKPVNIDGDNTIIRAFFKGELFIQAEVRIYIEYEEVEEIIGHEMESDEVEENDGEGKEIFL